MDICGRGFGRQQATPHIQIEAILLSANDTAMNLQEMHDEHVRHGLDAKDSMRFGLQAMRWSGWGSPVGFGILLLCVGGFLYLLRLAGLIG